MVLFDRLKPLASLKISLPSGVDILVGSNVGGATTAQEMLACEGSEKKSFDSLSARLRLKSLR